jgi:hypothetical protein
MGGAGDDLLLGNAGNDNISGGIGDDVLMGGLGDDRYLVNAGADEIFVGGGSDSLRLSGVLTEASFVNADGGDSTNDLRFTASFNNSEYTATIVNHGDGSDNALRYVELDLEGDGTKEQFEVDVSLIVGTADADTLTGSDTGGVLLGNAGNDYVIAIGSFVGIVAGSTIQKVTTGSTIKNVVARTSCQLIDANATSHDIVTCIAEQNSTGITSRQGICICRADYQADVYFKLFFGAVTLEVQFDIS